MPGFRTGLAEPRDGRKAPDLFSRRRRLQESACGPLRTSLTRNWCGRSIFKPARSFWICRRPARGSQFGRLDVDGVWPGVLRGEPRLLHGCGRGERQSPMGVSAQQNVAGFTPSPSRWAPASWSSRYRNSRTCPWPVGCRTEGRRTVGRRPEACPTYAHCGNIDPLNFASAF